MKSNLVHKVLWEKHPETRDTNSAAFTNQGEAPPPLPMQVLAATTAALGQYLHGTAGPLAVPVWPSFQ